MNKKTMSFPCLHTFNLHEIPKKCPCGAIVASAAEWKRRSWEVEEVADKEMSNFLL
jgi:hypothetical protein